MRSINSILNLLVKKKPLLYLLFVFAITSCVETSSKPIPGLATKEGGLICKDIYLSNDDGKINTNSFIYGDQIAINFNNIKGFKKENGNTFPGLRLLILDKKKDTIMFNPDLYSDNTNGFDLSPLLLFSKVMVANPIHSDNSYKAYVHVWDKKGKGTLDTSLEFKVIPDPKIATQTNGVSFDEIYLYSQKKGSSIINNLVPTNEDIYLVIQGLQGFVKENGKSSVGVRIEVTDADGNIILKEEDLTKDAPLDASELEEVIAPSFIITKGKVQNPIVFSVRIWDKKSDHEIKANVKLNVENN